MCKKANDTKQFRDIANSGGNERERERKRNGRKQRCGTSFVFFFSLSSLDNIQWSVHLHNVSIYFM